MDALNTTLGTVNIACGIVFVLISIPLVMKKIPMNPLYGFRIPAAFKSEENWYEINRYGGRQLIRWSVLLVLIGALYFIFPIEHSAAPVKNALLAAAPIVICPSVAIVKTILFSRQL